MKRSPGSTIRNVITAICLSTCAAGQTRANLSRWIAVSDLGWPVSIETGPEIKPAHQGFLACMEKLLRSNLHHGNTEQLSANLLLEFNPNKGAVIVGHGAPGLQCTGKGDICATDAESIYSGDIKNWEPLLSKIQPDIPIVTVLGCDIGKGKLGAQFLSEMAQVIKRPVRAPDSIVFCHPDGVEFYDNGQWVTARPGAEVESHDGMQYRVQPTNQADFKINEEYRLVPISAINIVKIQHRSYHESEFRDFTKADPKRLLSLIDFARPFENPGSPAAIVTGRIDVEVAFQNRQLQKKFILLNDELLEDATDPEVYYRTDVSLGEFFASR